MNVIFKLPCTVFFCSTCLGISFHVIAQTKLSEVQLPMSQLEEITVEGSPSKDNYSALTLPPVNSAQKNTTNLGNLLNDELGVSSTAFGNNASRPVLRGMSGSRVPILQNSMGSADLSSLSNDHAVSIDPVFLQKIQLLRGSDALRFASGSSAGLITLENHRITEELSPTPYVELQTQYNFQNQGYLAGLLTDQTIGQWALHVDGVNKSANNYQRPDGQNQNYSSSQLTDFGIGATYHHDQAYTGISYSQYQNYYGIPSIEGSFIDMTQKRFDVAHTAKNPFTRISQVDLKYSYSDYQHTEQTITTIPQTFFSNKVHQIRLEAFHDPYANWQGSVGLQLQSGQFSAIDLTNPIKTSAVVPPTQTNSFALFLVENTSWQQVDVRSGARLEYMRQNPDNMLPYSDQPNFSNSAIFTAPTRTSVQSQLFSASSSAFWQYAQGYKTGLTLQVTQRAPSVDELFSYGNHDATATFDIGNSALSKETVYQIEWGWKKTKGQLQGQVNLFHNLSMNYIYGQMMSAVDQISNFPVRQFTQADATISGYEAEILFNPEKRGVSVRLFSDGSKGIFEDKSNLPLQPAVRFGGQLGIDQAGWSTQLSLIHGLGQNRLASFENYPTPSYNKLDFRVSRNISVGGTMLTAYLMANNLLNDTIRYSTTIETIRVNAPLPGRSVVVGMTLAY